MPITDPLVLAGDVTITRAVDLSPELRARLEAGSDDSAITRHRGRAPAKLIDRDSAELLGEFRAATTVGAAVRAVAGRSGCDAGDLLERAFPLLRDCFNSKFLVPANAPEASPTLPSRARDDRIGRYRVLRCVQVLDDSELYQALHGDTGTLAAVKLVRPSSADPPSFSREVSTLVHLAGVGAPRFLDRGRHRGRAWIALEWREGVAPDRHAAELRDGGNRLRLRAVLCRLARAYAALHHAGILHGDVHPRNILIDRRGEVQILDMGLAQPIPPLRLRGRSRRGGIAEYLSPEHAAGALEGRFPLPTPASEQYSLAVVLYQLATGRFPIDHALDRAAMLAQLADPTPEPFVRRGVAAWPALERVLRRALAADPTDRYPSVVALADALDATKEPPRSSRGPRRRRLGADPRQVVEAFTTRVDCRGTAFASVSPAPRASIFLGDSGVSYALYRLACRRDDPTLFASAVAWHQRVLGSLDDPLAFEAPADGLRTSGLGRASPFHAATGVHLVGTLLALASLDLRGARAAVGEFLAAAGEPCEARDLTLGRMGVVHGCTHLIEALPPELATERAALTTLGQGAVDSVWAELDLLGLIGAPGVPEPRGIAHGWAGLIWATLRWYQAVCGVPSQNVARRLDELASGAEPIGRGVHWPQRDTGTSPSPLATDEISGWCAGPAGFVHLFNLADGVFSDTAFRSLADASAWSAWEAPGEVADLCCGLAGRAYALLAHYRRTGDPEWLGRATQLAGRAFIAFDGTRGSRVRPLSLFKGEAGIAVLAADLDQPEQAAFPFFEPEGFPRRGTDD